MSVPLRLVPPVSAPSPARLNLDDPRVLEMADFDHLPTEEWPTPETVVVTCGACGQPWVCQTRRELRARALEEW